MANIGKLIGTSLEAYANGVTEAIHAEAAVDIVASLKYFGPYWTGEFQDNWVILKGDSRAKRRPSEQTSRNKKPKNLTPVRSVPLVKYTGGKFRFSIDNEMKYTPYALDLLPIDTPDGPMTRGMFPGQTSILGNDWYRQYVQGGYLKEDLERAGFKIANNPKVKGYSTDPLTDKRRPNFR